MAIALSALFWTVACAIQGPVIPSGAYAALDSAALSLAKAGRVEEARRVVQLLDELGYAEAMRAKLETGLARESAKVKQAAEAVPEAAKKLQLAAKQLAPLLAKREGAERTDLARRILELDSTVDEAHVALGHTRIGASWATQDERGNLERRLEIESVRRSVAQLEVELETGESPDEFLTRVCGRPGVFVRRGPHMVHSALDLEKTVRVLREVERALAFSAYLRRGDVQLTPAKSGPFVSDVCLLFDSREHYLDAINLWEKDGNLSREDARLGRDLNAVSNDKNRTLVAPVTESVLETALLVHYSPLRDGVQTTLRAGHLNWVAMSTLGSPLPKYTFQESSGGVFHRGGTGIEESGAMKREREERWKLSRAGIVGCRTWMAWLAERGEDPRWEESFEDQLGKVRGEPLLKATSVAEFLQETNRLPKLIQASSKTGSAKPREVYEAALETSLGAFEDEWRRWILPRAKGLAQRVVKAPPDTPTREEKSVLAALNAVRARAFKNVIADTPEVGVERSLSEGASLHANYLGRNPDQAGKWPEAHEEYADHEGFTPEGAIAGASSVIAFGVERAEDAIEDWIDTFYHRIPLLEPGLLRIGLGWESDVVVMDVQSLWSPPEGNWAIVWPYDGMKSVPLAFGPEVPSPIPGVDTTTFGYPITLQVGLLEFGKAPSRIEMKLELDGKEVPCHFTTPDAPTNVELVPRNAYCLIPKKSLEPGKGYTVTATWKDSGKRMSWTFRT